jgi:hypothetical protein
MAAAHMVDVGTRQSVAGGVAALGNQLGERDASRLGVTPPEGAHLTPGCVRQ